MYLVDVADFNFHVTFVGLVVLTNVVAMSVDQDALVLASNSMPDWCQQFTISCPLLFPFETRQLYFNATAFGTSR